MSRFFSHLFIRPEGAYFEYALHHGLSVFLIVFSYLSNQWLVGIFVLVVHDYSDFGLQLARFYKVTHIYIQDYKHYSKKVLDMIYVHAMTAWILCRIVLFSYNCIYRGWDSYFNQIPRDPFYHEVLDFVHAFMLGMMISLEFLHLYWTYYIAESFVSVKVDPKLAKHTYD